MQDKWTALETEVDRIITENAAAFTSEAVAQVRNFLPVIRSRCSIPGVAAGYWRKSLRVFWTTVVPSLEIEIFGDRFEVYQFRDHHTDIRHIEHVPGHPLPAELIAALPTL